MSRRCLSQARTGWSRPDPGRAPGQAAKSSKLVSATAASPLSFSCVCAAPRSREHSIPTPPALTASPDILRVEDLRIGFAMQGGAAEVVRGVSFRVPAGKTVAPGRRIRVRQDGHLPMRDGPPAPQRAGPGRADHVRGSPDPRGTGRHREPAAGRAGDQGVARRSHRHDLPGAHVFALSGPQHRQPDPRSPGAASQGDQGPAARRSRAHARPRRLQEPEARLQDVPVRTVGRLAAAGHAGDGVDLPPGPADRRRAHDRPRRHDPGAGAEPHARAPAGTRHGDPDDHPRPRRGGQHGRRGCGGLSRRDHGSRHGLRHLPAPAAPLSQGAAEGAPPFRHGPWRAARGVARQRAEPVGPRHAAARRTDAAERSPAQSSRTCGSPTRSSEAASSARGGRASWRSTT